ncbi:hypothetical protein ACO0LD_06575 [Undibacterium sp. Ji83W]|uniref:hypothetical protein n=1 Tax=Undibacterium sp. Ji83W TaxID=3413043 RepID=UPI003BF29591
MDVGISEDFIHPVFDEGTCRQILERVLDIDAFWLPRHAQLPLFTLGATNYYDIAANPGRPYERLMQQFNPFLLDQFGDVYDAVLSALQARLNQPVIFSPGLALPGFHILTANPLFAYSDYYDIMHAPWFKRRDGAGVPGNPIHVDTAHMAVGLPDVVNGLKVPTLSFTLPIAMPAHGAGMKLWSYTESDIGDMDTEEALALLKQADSKLVPYSLGGVFVHSGVTYHQARGFPSGAGQYRITLQGHGAWLDGQWHLFW